MEECLFVLNKGGMMKERVYNFAPGPAVLPVSVLETVRDNILNYNGCGIGVMELSHRSPQFEEIIATAEKNLRELLSISEDYAVIFCGGGARTQFSAVPMNLLSAGSCADYLITGYWAEYAYKEAKRFAEVNVAASSKDDGFTFIPTNLQLSNNSVYLHFTSNNTIVGTQFAKEPEAGSCTLVCDASSDICSRPIDVSKYGIIYAGAQKNLGPAGVTIVIIKQALLEHIPQSLPKMLDYRTFVEKKSLFNTPPTFNIYVVGEVLKWIKKQGGMRAIQQNNEKKAALLYDYIDASDYYEGIVRKDSRSKMNVTFRLKNREKEAEFVKTAAAAGFDGLGGHRTFGGMRASIYNAFPLEGVKELVSFMKNFEARN